MVSVVTLVTFPDGMRNVQVILCRRVGFDSSFFRTQRARFHAVSINLPLRERGGWEGAKRQIPKIPPAEKDTQTPRPPQSLFMPDRPLECWPLRELIGDVYKVANMTSLRSQVIKTFHMVHGMFKGSFSDEKKFVLR